MPLPCFLLEGCVAILACAPKQFQAGVVVLVCHTAHACLQDLAAASQEQVNDVWAGLGYYRRARLLLEGAQHVQANLSGKIPVNSVELQKIPGLLCSLEGCVTCTAVCFDHICIAPPPARSVQPLPD